MGRLIHSAARRALAGLVAGCIVVPAGTVAADEGTFSDRPLDAPILRALNGSIEFTASRIEWHGNVARDARVPVHVQDGSVSVARGHLRLGEEGTVDVDASHAADGTAVLHLSVRRLDLGAIGPWRAYLPYAPVDLEVDLRGQGPSLHRLMAGANGRVRARNHGPGRVHRTLDRAGANLVFNMLRSLEPNPDVNAQTTLECFAMDLPVTGGQVIEGHAFELRTPRMHVRGSGRIDFDDETLALEFVPRSRAPIELKSLQSVRTVYVRGGLAAPKVTVDTGHLLGRAASLPRDVARLGGGAVLGALIGQHEISLCDRPL